MFLAASSLSLPADARRTRGVNHGANRESHASAQSACLHSLSVARRDAGMWQKPPTVEMVPRAPALSRVRERCWRDTP